MADERQTHRYPSPSPKQDSVSFTYTAQGHSQRLNQSSPDTMAASVTLPSIQDPRASSYGAAPPSVSGHGRPYPDTRYEAVRESPNGYPPHGQQQPPPAPPPTSHHPPPPQYQQPDPRSPAYPPPHDQRGYYPDPRAQAPYSHDPYRQEAYFYQAPPQAGYAPYGGDGRMHYGAPGQSQAQAAPRQRTSIACRYCRKRKIRCSGYQTAPGGKCQNCARMNQECIFQPVSSSSSAAFIPVSAVPGGVPPGTPLYGAYGQPLAPAHHAPYPHGPPGPLPGPPPGQHPPPQHAHPGPYYQAPAHSPTESYSSFGESRNEESLSTTRRRRRTSEEQDEGYRRPPPRVSGEEDPRRRSPAEFSNHSSPSGFGHPQHGSTTRQSPRSLALAQPPTSTTAPGGRSPALANGSSGTSTPAGASQSSQQNQQGGGSSVMSLSNLVDKNDIDQGMINRLNRPKPTTPSQQAGQNGSR